MFAPWCPTCSRRMLLGPRRVEAIETGASGPRVVLRCHCDTVLVWSPASEAGDPAVLAGGGGAGGTVDVGTASGADRGAAGLVGTPR